MTDTEIMTSSGAEILSTNSWDHSRRGLLKLLGGLGLIGSVQITSAQQTPTNESWTQFRYDASLTGYAPENTGPVASIENDWTTSIGDISLEQSEVQTPIVTGESVFTGISDGTLVALNRNDATERWRVQRDARIWGAPAVSGETLLCGTVRGSPEPDGDISIEGGGVHAFDIQTGSERWSLKLPSSVNNGLTVSDDTVYCCCLGAGLYAIDIATGTERWVYETEALVEESPAVADDTVYFGDNDGYIHAVRATDGTERWRFRANDAIRSSPVVASGFVIVGSDDNLVYALNVSDGSEEWSYTASDQIRVSPTVANNSAYVGSMDGTLYRLNVDDGAERWAVDLPDSSEPYPLEPALVDGVLYVGYWQDDVYAVNPGDGTESWSSNIDTGVSSSAAIADGTVYIGSQNAAVSAITGSTSVPTGTGQADSDATGTQLSAEPTEPAGRPTGAVAQQQGTVTDKSPINEKKSSGSLWRQFGSGPTVGIGSLMLALSLAGIYEVYRRLSREGDE